MESPPVEPDPRGVYFPQKMRHWQQIGFLSLHIVLLVVSIPMALLMFLADAFGPSRLSGIDALQGAAAAFFLGGALGCYAGYRNSVLSVGAAVIICGFGFLGLGMGFTSGAGSQAVLTCVIAALIYGGVAYLCWPRHIPDPPMMDRSGGDVSDSM